MRLALVLFLEDHQRALLCCLDGHHLGSGATLAPCHRSLAGLAGNPKVWDFLKKNALIMGGAPAAVCMGGLGVAVELLVDV